MTVDQCQSGEQYLCFPGDNMKDKTEAAIMVQQELLQNIAELENQYDKVLLVGDFKAKIRDFRDINYHSSNGELLEHLIEVTEMVVLHCDND